MVISRFFPFLVWLAAVAFTGPASAVVLYMTTFDGFPVGKDTISLFKGWRASAQGQGLHGTDFNIIPGLGKSGYLGRNRPSADVSFVSVWRPINYDPIAANAPIVEFFAIVGIADSTNGQRDNFYITLYDTKNKLLGAVNFDNTKERFGIWRYDGENYHRASRSFIRGQVHELYVRINYATETWSAELDFLPLFRDEPIDFEGKSKTIGSFAAEWEISKPGSSGNNWMFFDEWTVEVSQLPEVTTEFSFEPVSKQLKMNWAVQELGYSYQIEKSADLSTWEAVKVFTPDRRGKSSIPLEAKDPFCFYRLKQSLATETAE